MINNDDINGNDVNINNDNVNNNIDKYAGMDAKTRSKRKHYDKYYTKIAVNVKKEEKKEFDDYLLKTGKNMSEWLKEAIREKMEREECRRRGEKIEV